MTTALEFVRQLGLGWNLGNTFDAFPLQGEHEKAVNEGRTWTPEDQERLWFNQPFTPSVPAGSPPGMVRSSVGQGVARYRPHPPLR